MFQEAQIVKQVLGYFMRNPEAADDLEGVARWRLLDEAVHRTVDETERAIVWLVRSGFLVETDTAGGGRVFHINEARRDEAENFLKCDVSMKS
jgi:hypothetical protein